MLYEISKIQQVPGEPHRRWFFSHEQDLLIWFGDDGKPVAFQLSYGKYRDEHAIRWKEDRGFTHYSVDDGESGALTSDTPILMADGMFAASRVLRRFIELSAAIPREVADFVAARLREHPDFHEDTAKPRSHQSEVITSAVAIGLTFALIGLMLWVLRSSRIPARVPRRAGQER